MLVKLDQINKQQKASRCVVLKNQRGDVDWRGLEDGWMQECDRTRQLQKEQSELSPTAQVV